MIKYTYHSCGDFTHSFKCVKLLSLLVHHSVDLADGSFSKFALKTVVGSTLVLNDRFLSIGTIVLR